MTEVLKLTIVVVLGLAACVTVVRLIRGPSVLDRVAASDNLLAVLLSALGLHAALGHPETLTILVTVAMIGFLASAGVARFMPRSYWRGRGAPPYRSTHSSRARGGGGSTQTTDGGAA